MFDFYGKDQLQSWLATVVPHASLQATSLPLCPDLQLYLLAEDCQQGPYSATQTELIMRETPYWCFCWASGQAMARFLLDDPSWVKNKSVLDFGSGSGIAGIAAHKAGAKRVVACDIDMHALSATQLNAQLNQTRLEFRDDLYKVDEVFDIALVADVLYDRENWPLLDDIQKVAKQILVADSRVKKMPSLHYRVIDNMNATTLPDLNEFDEFKSVVFYHRS
jgi:predicted nicotinamide N-methyase